MKMNETMHNKMATRVANLPVGAAASVVAIATLIGIAADKRLRQASAAIQDDSLRIESAANSMRTNLLVVEAMAGHSSSSLTTGEQRNMVEVAKTGGHGKYVVRDRLLEPSWGVTGSTSVENSVFTIPATELRPALAIGSAIGLIGGVGLSLAFGMKRGGLISHPVILANLDKAPGLDRIVAIGGTAAVIAGIIALTVLFMTSTIPIEFSGGNNTGERVEAINPARSSADTQDSITLFDANSVDDPVTSLHTDSYKHLDELVDRGSGYERIEVYTNSNASFYMRKLVAAGLLVTIIAVLAVLILLINTTGSDPYILDTVVPATRQAAYLFGSVLMYLVVTNIDIADIF